MSATDDDGEEIPGREIAYRLFAAEYDDASMSYAESDEERAPNYVISPTGARLNRLFAVGTLTEVTSVNEEMVRARVVDPTGAFVVYAGQYQPDALATLEQLDPPAFVAVTGKARTFQPDDSDQVYTSIRPESIATVDAATRDRWVVSAAEQTLERVGTYAAAAETEASGDALTDALREAGVESGLAAGIPLAQAHYGTTPTYLAALRDCALEAVEVVAGERDQVGGLALQPGDSSPEYESTTFDSLAALAGVDHSALESLAETEAEAQPAEAAVAAGGETVTDEIDADDGSFGTGSAAGTATGTARESESVTDADIETESEPVADAALETDDSSGDDAMSTEADSTNTESSAVEPSGSEPDETATATADAAVDTDDADEASAAAVDDAPGGDEASDEPESAADDADSDEDELGDFDADEGGMYEMDEEEREQLEEEFGAEFTTGSEVDDPGEAGIDVPEPTDDAAGDADTADDDLGAPPESGLEAETDSDADTSSATDSEPATEEIDLESEDEGAATDADEQADETDADADDEPDEDSDEADESAEDIDLDTVVIETMEDLDDGDGADRSELVEAVAADTGVAEADVEDAIQDALMGGQCYEPDDETLKAI